jgi:large subunit ribosomal protein L10
MAITKDQKKEISSKIGNILNTNKSVVFVSFKGLDVARTSEMRSELKKDGIGYMVVKKTLAKRTMESAEISGERPVLEGELALAYCNDTIMPSKSIAHYQKKFAGAVTALGGILEGSFLSKDDVSNLAKIPGREVLYGQLVTVMNAPIQQTVQVLNAVPQSFVGVLDQISKKEVSS